MNQTEPIETLWQKLATHLTEQSRPVVQRAYDFASQAHEGQWRDGRDNAPYISHPLRVALILAEEAGVTDGEILAVALLHDVLEDTEVEYPALRDKMDPDIANAVELLTKESADPGDRAVRDSAYYSNVINGGEGVRLVKCADRLDNLRALRTLDDPDRWRKYVDETREHVLPIAALTNPYFHEALNEIIA